LKGALIARYGVETVIKELDLRQRSGELVLREAVERGFFSLARSVRDSLQNLPPRVSGLCAAERNQGKIFVLLTREIDQCLEGLTNGYLRHPLPNSRTLDEMPDVIMLLAKEQLDDHEHKTKNSDNQTQFSDMTPNKAVILSYSYGASRQ
jgi:hypothetical protein